jgi:hypothetical protein
MVRDCGILPVMAGKNPQPLNVAALRVGGEVERWRELGFEVGSDGVVVAGRIRIELLASARSGRIASWALEGPEVPKSIDGLPTDTAPRTADDVAHPNGVTGIDHVVVLTPSLERTTEAFAEIGVECRRVREPGGDIRQGFFLLGDVLIEVVEGPGAEADKPATLWGITLIVADIDRAASLLGDKAGEVKDAVQPGRRITTVRKEASGGLPLALITPRTHSTD